MKHSKSNEKVFSSRASATVDYENLLDTSFTDSNRSANIKTSVLPRWERKKLQQKQKQNGHVLTNCSNNNATNTSGGDRYIPSRSGMDIAKHHMRSSTAATSSSSTTKTTTTGEGGSVESSSNEENTITTKAVTDSKKDMYESNLSSALLGVEDIKNSRILSYQDKAPTPSGDTISNLNVLYSASAAASVQKKANTKLVSRHIPTCPSRILDAPDLKDDYYLNLVDWSDTNWLAIALDRMVFLWNADTGDIEELCTVDDGPDPHVSSLSWVQEGGTHLAVGTSSGHTQLWDVNESKKVRSMGGHTDRVGALAWNRHILSSGSRDTNIVHHDVRVARHNVATLSMHQQEVCGLTWSPDGEMLASGANDNLLCLWDASRNVPLHRLTDHQAAVRALAWSPHERHLLASGGGTADRTIKFWSSQTGCLLNSIDTGSQVCVLKWNPYEKEILSSHGFQRNQLSLWKYPSMAKIKDFEGHSSRVLHMAVGPTGTVLSAAGDETLRFWDMFAPPVAKSAPTGAAAAMKKHELTTLAGSSKASWTMQIR